MYTLLAVILVGAVFCFFSQEFVHFFKKILAVPGLDVILPLAFASLVLNLLSYWLIAFIEFCRRALYDIVFFLVSSLPFNNLNYYCATLLVLLSISLVIVVVEKMVLEKTHYKNVSDAYFYGVLIWIASVMILASIDT